MDLDRRLDMRVAERVRRRGARLVVHAHVELDGVDVGPGDEVLVHDAPAQVAYGEHLVCSRRATVTQAGWIGRLWTRATSRFEIAMLYEVSFSPGAVQRAPRRSQP